MIMTSYFAEKSFTGKVEADVGVSRPQRTKIFQKSPEDNAKNLLEI